MNQVNSLYDSFGKERNKQVSDNLNLLCNDIPLNITELKNDKARTVNNTLEFSECIKKKETIFCVISFGLIFILSGL